MKRPEIKKHHVLRVADWAYSIALILYGALWSFGWTRVAIKGQTILIVYGGGRMGGGNMTSTVMYPEVMWLFALLGVFVAIIGIRNIRRLLANESIG